MVKVDMSLIIVVLIKLFNFVIATVPNMSIPVLVIIHVMDILLAHAIIPVMDILPAHVMPHVIYTTMQRF